MPTINGDGCEVSVINIGHGSYGNVFKIIEKNPADNIVAVKIIKSIGKKIRFHNYVNFEAEEQKEHIVANILSIVSQGFDNWQKNIDFANLALPEIFHSTTPAEFYDQFKSLAQEEALIKLEELWSEAYEWHCQEQTNKAKEKMFLKIVQEQKILEKLELSSGQITETKDSYNLHMKFCSGVTLDKLDIKDPELARRIALSLINQLITIHDAGIVHNDLKPANVVVNGDHAAVIDFGESILLEEMSMRVVISSERPVGTRHYMAPEVAGMNTAICGGLRKKSDGERMNVLQRGLLSMLKIMVNNQEELEPQTGSPVNYGKKKSIVMSPLVQSKVRIFLRERDFSIEEEKLMRVVASNSMCNSISSENDSTEIYMPFLISTQSDIYSLGKTLYDLFKNFDTNGKTSALGEILCATINPNPESRTKLSELEKMLESVEIMLIPVGFIPDMAGGECNYNLEGNDSFDDLQSEASAINSCDSALVNLLGSPVMVSDDVLEQSRNRTILVDGLQVDDSLCESVVAQVSSKPHIPRLFLPAQNVYAIAKSNRSAVNTSRVDSKIMAMCPYAKQDKVSQQWWHYHSKYRAEQDVTSTVVKNSPR